MKNRDVILLSIAVVVGFFLTVIYINLNNSSKNPTTTQPAETPIDNIIIEINAGTKLALRDIKNGKVGAVAPFCWDPTWVYVSADRYPTSKVDQVPEHPMSQGLQEKANNVAKAMGELLRALNEEAEMTKK